MCTATFVVICYEKAKVWISHVQHRQDLHHSPPGLDFPLSKLQAKDRARYWHQGVELKPLYNRP
jgi:hypothetical protein